MVTLKRNKQKLYLCKQKIENNITKYKEPILIETNYQPTNSTGEIIGIGNEYILYLKIKDVKEICSIFSNGDRCFVYEKVPSEYDPMCQGADFYVDGEPLITLNSGEVRLKRMTGADMN